MKEDDVYRESERLTETSPLVNRSEPTPSTGEYPVPPDPQDAVDCETCQ